MEHRHLWLRSPRQAAILRVRAEIIKAARDFFDDRGFTLPIHRSLLPRLAKGQPRCFRWTISRSRRSSRSRVSSTLKLRRWRWERSTASARRSARRNRRRAAIYRVLDGGARSRVCQLDDLMELAEEFITFIVKRCLEKRPPELETIGRDIAKLEKIDDAVPAHHVTTRR